MAKKPDTDDAYFDVANFGVESALPNGLGPSEDFHAAVVYERPAEKPAGAAPTSERAVMTPSQLFHGNRPAKKSSDGPALS